MVVKRADGDDHNINVAQSRDDLALRTRYVDGDGVYSAFP